MRSAIKQALLAKKLKRVPIGAVIVKGNQVIARAHNQKDFLQDATAHAEILAIRKAGKKLGPNLDDCSMYVTLKPCLMCLSACYWAHLKTIYYGAGRKTGNRYFVTKDNQTEEQLLNNLAIGNLDIKGSILENECESLLTKRVFWVFGPAAAGKSTFIKLAVKELSRQGKKSLILSDLNELVYLIKRDKEHKLHIQIGSQQFKVIDCSLYDQCMRRLVRKALNNLQKKDYVFGEVSCGIDSEGQFDLSLEHRISLISKGQFDHSQYIYIDNPFKRRMEFNLKRKGIIQTPSEIFSRFFKYDDSAILVKTRNFNFITVRNHGNLNEFSEQVKSIIQL
jgi:tRNA(adenine34) deaminase